jgi:UDP-N-acetylmuramoyl-L-alanyl-D-glutamate--2,6-diaminopimelate ligase
MDRSNNLGITSVGALLHTFQQDLLKTSSTLGEVSFGHLVMDSRDVCPGDAFVAVPGTATDGRRFIPNAIAQGASVVLEPSTYASIERVDGCVRIGLPNLMEALPEMLHWRYSQAKQVRLLAVTGTNGKSSVAQYIAQLASSSGIACGVIGTTGNGVWPDLHPTRNTTPGLDVMLRTLDAWARSGVGLAAVEVSSHGLEQGRVQGLKFAVAALTNLTQDHLDYHGDMESYYQAKRLLFTDYRIQQAFINIDDAYGRRLLSELPQTVKPVMLGNAQAEGAPSVERWSWSSASFGVRGIQAELVYPGGQRTLHLPLIGGFNLANAVLAVGMLSALGVDESVLLDATRKLKPVDGRMELLTCPDKPAVVLDFAHTPDALENVLAALQDGQRSVSVVFGCGGDRDRRKRPLMMQAALAASSQIWLTDDNPRYEDPDQIWADALAVTGAETVHCQHDRALAIQDAVEQTPIDGLVVVAGKGHETTQEIQGQKRPFSDLQVLAGLGYRRMGEHA